MASRTRSPRAKATWTSSSAASTSIPRTPSRRSRIPALDPGDDTLAERLDNDRCFVSAFDDPNVGNDRFERTVTVPLNVPIFSQGDGFYGWYAIAAKRPEDIFGDRVDDEDHCLDIDHFFTQECDYQSPEGSGETTNVSLPAAASARVGSDTVAPTYDTPAASRAAERLRRLPGRVAVPARAQGAPEGAGERRHVGDRHRDLHGLQRRPRRAGLHARGVRRARRRRRPTA